MTFEKSLEWCESLSDQKPFELITPIGDEEEDYFLNFAQHFWIGIRLNEISHTIWLLSYVPYDMVYMIWIISRDSKQKHETIFVSF